MTTRGGSVPGTVGTATGSSGSNSSSGRKTDASISATHPRLSAMNSACGGGGGLDRGTATPPRQRGIFRQRDNVTQYPSSASASLSECRQRQQRIMSNPPSHEHKRERSVNNSGSPYSHFSCKRLPMQQIQRQNSEQGESTLPQPQQVQKQSCGIPKNRNEQNPPRNKSLALGCNGNRRSQSQQDSNRERFSPLCCSSPRRIFQNSQVSSTGQ